jgi:hypothetical protein
VAELVFALHTRGKKAAARANFYTFSDVFNEMNKFGSAGREADSSREWCAVINAANWL